MVLPSVQSSPLAIPTSTTIVLNTILIHSLLNAPEDDESQELNPPPLYMYESFDWLQQGLTLTSLFNIEHSI